MLHPHLQRMNCGALCILLAACLCCGCTDPEPDRCTGTEVLSSSVTTETPSDENLLDDGRLRILYGSDNSANGSTVLCGSKVIYQGAHSESLNLVQDSLTGEVNYYWRQWSDKSSPSGRCSALYDASGNQVLAFEKDLSVRLTNGILVLSDALYSDEIPDEQERCSVINLSTGRYLPVPENAYNCIISGDALVFSLYERPEDLAAGAYDEDRLYHTSVLVTDFEGSLRLEQPHCFASELYSSSLTDSDLIQMDLYDVNSQCIESALYSPTTGEWLTGFEQICDDGIFCFDTGSGHQLLDLSGENPVLLGTFDAPVVAYAPGIVVLWHEAYSAENHYELVELASGTVYRLKDYSTSNDLIAVYLENDALRIYDRNSGALKHESTLESFDSGITYLYFETSGVLRVDHYGAQPTTRYFTQNGAVTGLDTAFEKYSAVYSLTQAADGSILYWARYNAPGGANSLFDVLDEQGNVLVKGLSSCYCYYDTALQSLPKGSFVAQKGFYYGWMNADGEWLYCRSIFSSIEADENADFFS